MIKRNSEHFCGIMPFDFSISYANINSDSQKNEFESHIHNECEIYINLSGNVSFVVENNIYPISPGSIILTRPFEYHHCVYHSNAPHRHFWILFSCSGNEDLLPLFFERGVGENNHLTLDPQETEELIDLCHKMTSAYTSQAEKYLDFFKFLELLNHADKAIKSKSNIPQDVVFAVNYISENLSSPISVSEIAEQSNVSINTLERHFSQHLKCSPTVYLKKKRLANAIKLLISGSNVSEAAEKSGFSDYSYFIATFKKEYGLSPLKYIKLRGE